jgi:hypothetical protein
MVWNVYHEKKDGIRRMLASKFNLIEEAPGLEYEVKKGVVRFLQTKVDMLADDFLEEYRAQTKRGKRKQDIGEVEQWLHDFLKDGPKSCGDKSDPPDADTIFGAIKRTRFSRNTVYDAAKNLGVIKRCPGFREKWVWELPKGDESGETPPDFEEWHG